jgi:hypothetical protein
MIGGRTPWSDARIIQDQRLDQVVDVAAMIRPVDDAALRDRLDRQLLMFADPLDLAQDRIERILERPIQLVALRRLQFVQILQHARARRVALDAMAALEETSDVCPGKDGCSDGVGAHWQMLLWRSAASLV